MKTKNLTRAIAAALLLFIGSNVSAQKLNKLDVSRIKDCCLMTDGKMMQLKSGQLTPLRKAVKLENGTKIKRNGVCVLPDHTRIHLKEGNCVDMSGVISDCAVIDKDKPKEVTTM